VSGRLTPRTGEEGKAVYRGRCRSAWAYRGSDRIIDTFGPAPQVSRPASADPMVVLDLGEFRDDSDTVTQVSDLFVRFESSLRCGRRRIDGLVSV